MAPLVRRTWALKGRTPFLYQKTCSHKKVSMIAALTLSTKCQRIGLYFSMHPNANIASRKVVRFLKILSKHIQKPIFIIWDRSRIHRSNIIIRFLKNHSRLHAAFFPAYAPELNPVEPFWGYLKQNPLANFTPQDTQSLSRTARYHGKRIKNRQSILRSFLYATPLF